MADPKPNWLLNGDCVEACTSPAVCPYYWGSSAPTALHGGKDQCEGAFTFRIRKGHCEDIDLSGLMAGYGFNTGIGGPGSGDPWKTVLYIDERADEQQFACLTEIFQTCWTLAGQVLKVKKVAFRFEKEKVGSHANAGYKHLVQWKGTYFLKTEPLLARDGAARFITGLSNGRIYVGKSVENSFSDVDLPRGSWNSPGMSNTYFEFTIDTETLDWVP